MDHKGIADNGNSTFEFLSKERYGLASKVAVRMESAVNAKTIATLRQDRDNLVYVATSLTNYGIIVYQGEHLSKVATLQGHKKMVTDLKFSNANPNTLYSSSLDGTITVWDLRQGCSVRQFEDHTREEFKPIASFDLSCDENFLCGGTELIITDSYLLFWDLRKSALLGGYWESHSDVITQVVFHKSEPSTLITGSTDGLINLFNISESNEDDALLNTFNTESSVDVLRWCRNGQYLACLTHTETIQLWNVEEAELCKTYDRGDFAIKLQINEPPARFLNLVVNEKTECPAVIASTTRNSALLIEMEESGFVLHTELNGEHKSPIICADWDAEREWSITADENGYLCYWRKQAETMKIKLEGKLKMTSSGKDKVTKSGNSRQKPY